MWAGTPEASELGQYGATFSLYDGTEPRDALAAARDGERVFRAKARSARRPALPIVRLEAITFAEQDAELGL